MNKRRDYLLSYLSIDKFKWCKSSAISSAFHQAGFGSPQPCLQRMISEGYVERGVWEIEQFRLSDKGEAIYQQGGFAHKAEIAHEVRVAMLCTVVAIVGLLAIILSVS